MTNQNQPVPPEQRAAQAEREKSILQSMLGETKQIAAGLTERCSQLAAERDIQASDANQLRNIVQSQAQDINAKDEQIKSLIADRDAANSASVLPPPGVEAAAS